MKFSLIIPAYNVAPYITICLQSIQEQSFQDFEVLIIDDGSTDNTSDIVSNFCKHDNRFKLFHKENGGVSSARNLGLSKATGQYIWFIDSDDYIHLRSLEYLVNAFRQFPEADYMTFHCQKVLEDAPRKVDSDNFKAVPLSRYILTKCDDFLSAFHVSPREACLICYRREILTNMFYDKFKLGEDTLFNKKVLYRAKEVIESRAVLYYYVTRASSASHNPSFEHVIDYFAIIRELSTLKGKKGGIADYALSVFLWQIGLVEGMTRLHRLADRQQRKIAKESWMEVTGHYLAIFQKQAVNYRRLKVICWSRSCFLADLFFFVRYIPRNYIQNHPNLARKLRIFHGFF